MKSTKYWANVTTEATTVDDQTTQVSVEGQIQASDVMGAIQAPGLSVGARVTVGDPLALVREQMASSVALPAAAAANPASAPATPVAAASSGRFLDAT